MGGINAQAKEREPVFRERSKASHWFKPSQAYVLSVIRTESRRMAPGRLREIVPARETPRRMPEFEYVPVAKPGDQ